MSLTSSQIEEEDPARFFEHDYLLAGSLEKLIDQQRDVPDLDPKTLPIMLVGIGTGAQMAHEFVARKGKDYNISEVISVGYKPIKMYQNLDPSTNFTYTASDYISTHDAELDHYTLASENFDFSKNPGFEPFLNDPEKNEELWFQEICAWLE
jgi:hypothetical protein